MGEIRDTANEVYRDYEVDGLPSSGAHEPAKSGIRALLGEVEDAVNLAGENGAYILRDDEAALAADLDHDADTYALVQFDADPDKNGYWKKVGASGTGSWTRIGPDPRLEAAATAQAAADDAENFKDEAEAGAAAAVSAMPKVLAGLGGDLEALFTTEKGDATINTSTFSSGTFGQLHPDPFGADGIVSHVKINVGSAGDGVLFIRDPETETVTWTADVTLASGINTFIGGLHFPLRKMTRGQSLGYYPVGGTSAKIKYGATISGATPKYFSSASTPAEGDSIAAGALVDWTGDFAISYTLVSGQDPAEAQTEIRSRVRIASERFVGTSTPAGWTLGAAFTVSDGLVSSGSGGWGNYTYQSVYSASAQREIAARVTFGSATSKWAIAAKPNPAGQAFFGGALIVDGSTSKLGIYTWTGSSSAGTLLSEVSIPTLSTTASYVLRMTVADLSLRGELIDATGEVVASVTDDSLMSGSGDAAAFKGGVAAIHFAGSATADWIEAYSLYPKRLKLLIVGDSNLAGTVAASIGQTWGMRLAALRPLKDIMVSAVGGDEGQWLSGRLTLDLNLFNPEKVLIVVGSNYTSQATWRTDVKAMIAAIVAAGAEPAIATQIPISGSGNQTRANAMNADILSGYFGDLRVVDLAAAITDDGDRVTWHYPGTDNGDGIHMSLTGQIAAYEYVRDNYPWLWLDAPNPFLA